MGQTNVSVTSVLRLMFISLWGISLLKHWVFVGKLWKRIEIGPTGDSTCWQRSYLDNVSLQLCVMSENSSKRKNEQDPTDTFPEQGEGVITEVWSLSAHQMCKQKFSHFFFHKILCDRLYAQTVYDVILKFQREGKMPQVAPPFQAPMETRRWVKIVSVVPGSQCVLIHVQNYHRCHIRTP